MNRQELFAEVLIDLNREDKADRLPGWLTSAEFRINQMLRVEDMVRNSLLEITELRFPVPPNYLAPFSLSIRRASGTVGIPGEKVGTALYVPPAQMDNDPSAFIRNNPYWFTVRGNFVELGGWRNPGPFQVDLFYYAELDKLPNPTSTNFLLATAPHVYKDGMLHFGFRHLQEPQAANDHLTTMAAEIQAMNNRAEETKHGAGPLIARPIRSYGTGRRRR